MFEGLFQPLHLLVVVVIVLLIFGPNKLPELGKGLGEAIRGFKRGITDSEAVNTRSDVATRKPEDKETK